ncbi:hypothetical protein MHTCC0001_17250 [Flavobacteriaceae bacterium MHTCC 0001]
MNRLIYIILILLIFACDSEKANDCFQTTGAIIQEDITVANFDKILVNQGVELILKEGSEQKIIVETGVNLLNDISVSVENETLILTDGNTCNYVRKYGVTKVYVTSPNIIEIRSSTQYGISSDGVLTYPSLSVFSEDFNAPDTFTVGDFNLTINSTSFSGIFNGTTLCFIRGTTNNLNINFPSGDSRFNGRDLIAQDVNIFHRGSNDMIVNPQEEITGVITSTGNVISVSRPNTINVDTRYKGQLIFE